MVRTVHRCAAAAAAALALAGCELFTATPFPAFLDKTDISIDLAHRIDAIAAGKGISSYDLEVVTASGQPSRVLLLAEPPSSDPSGGYNYTGKLIFMDKDLNVLGEASTSTLGYFSRPYTYSSDSDNDILAGYTILTSTGAPAAVPPAPAGGLSPSGLEGFGFTDGTTTWVFATPSGQYSSFDLSFFGYTNAWGIFPATASLPIIPVADRPSSSDPNYANLGFQLVGLSYDPVSTNITFVLSRPSTGEIMATRLSLATATGGSGVLLPTGASWPLSVTVDRPAVSVDSDGLFLVRRDGWMERYTWTGTGIPLAVKGDPVQVVGDRSLSRRYAFLVDPAGGTFYMYRFDPSSRVLTRYKRWW